MSPKFPLPASCGAVNAPTFVLPEPVTLAPAALMLLSAPRQQTHTSPAPDVTDGWSMLPELTPVPRVAICVKLLPPSVLIQTRTWPVSGAACAGTAPTSCNAAAQSSAPKRTSLPCRRALLPTTAQGPLVAGTCLEPTLNRPRRPRQGRGLVLQLLRRRKQDSRLTEV